MRPANFVSSARSVLIGVVLLVCAGACAFDTAPDLTGLDLCPNGPETPAKIQLQPSPLNLRVGDNVPFAVAMTGKDGSSFILCPPVLTWATDNSAVATVSDGVVRGVSVGQTVIRVQAATESDSAIVIIS